MIAAFVCSRAIAADYLGKVLAVSDEDTFTMEADGAKVSERIWGIDASERGQAGYGQTAGVLSSMIEGKTVRCLQVVKAPSATRGPDLPAGTASWHSASSTRSTSQNR
jgi:endonuclease YncB( thermonuclease family)